MQEQKTYNITIEGVLTETLHEWFTDIEIREFQGNTILVCTVPDQSYLYGLIGRLRDLGLTLLALNRI